MESTYTTVATMWPDGDGPSESKGTISERKSERRGQYVKSDPRK